MKHENKSEQLSFSDLERLVKGNNASHEQIAEYMRRRDLGGLPSERTYEIESRQTKEWFCPNCGGPIPCSIDCPQCDHPRPEGNHDPEQEGRMGKWRKRAGTR